MTIALDDPFPPLLAHSLRKEWGVGILAGESDGKLRYLFENGEERTMAPGFQEMMRRVETPSVEQQAAYARMRGVLAARSGAGEGVRPGGLSFLEQLKRFRAVYPGGLSDPRWMTDIRGEGAEKRAPRHRQPLLQEAAELLSQKALDSLLSGQQYGQVWERVLTLLGDSDLVPAAQLKAKVSNDDQRRALAIAVREHLYGTVPPEQRFDRLLTAGAMAFGAPLRWELSTALAAVVHPTEHVCVEPTTFRKQLQAGVLHRAVSAKPSGNGYAALLGMIRLTANKLAEQGEQPRDLFDVRDFIVSTLKAAPKKKAAAAK